MAKVLLTPERAEELLENNHHNRKITQQRVREYSKEMMSGLWLYNGESIIVSESGRLLDGQHRLLAVIDSGVTIETELVEGVPDTDNGVDTFLTINTKNRSNVDALTIAGFKDRPQHIAKLLSFREAFNNKRLMQQASGTKLLNHEVVELARDFGETNAIRIVDRAMNLAVRTDLLAVPFWILAVYVFEGLPMGNDFLEEIAEGQGGREGDPVSAYLTRLEDFKRAGHGGAAINKGKWLGMFKAYKAKVEGKEIRIMRLSIAQPLDYPVLFKGYED